VAVATDDASGSALPAGSGLVLDTAGAGSIAVDGVDFAGADGSREKYIGLAISRAGLTPGELCIYWNDFLDAQYNAPPGVVTNFAGTGALGGVSAGSGGGIGKVTTGATAGSVARLLSRSNIVANMNTSRFYFAGRARIETAVDGQASIGFGLLNQSENNSLAAGFFGLMDAVNYRVQHSGNYAGSSLNLAVPVDLNVFHIFEMYAKADGILRARIDGGSEVSAAYTASTEFGMFGQTSLNGTTAAARMMGMDWALIVTPRS
jgi:hypothetical protein